MNRKSVLATSLGLAAVIAAVVLLSNLVLVQAAPQGPWIRHADNPVLSPGDEGEWDQNAVYYATVIYDGASYKMWYTGYDSDWVARIGYAESLDGVHWTKHTGNPVISPGAEGSWDSAWVGMPTVVKTGSDYAMWYAGRDSDGIYRIGYATSTNGTDWTKHTSNPVLGPGPVGTWDDAGVRSPTVLYRDGLFHMWYHGWGERGWDTPGCIGYATSSNGVNWTKSPDNPVLAGGESGSWEYPAVFGPSVLFDPEAAVYRMWYTAFNDDVDGGKNRFGYAVSADGVHWTKHSLNPVFYPGEPGSWDAGDMHGPCVILEGDTFKMWYAAHDGSGSYGIGHAVAEPGASIVGHVYDQSTDPLPDARIYALDDELNVIAGAVSGADGGYAIVDLPTDDYYLEISADGYGREYYDDSYNIAGAAPVSVTVPITTAGVDFTLAPDGAISGHVYGPDGVTAFEGAMVEVKPAGGGRPLETTSASDGAYTVDGLATGSYNAWAGHSSYLADSVDVPVSVTQPNTTTNTDFSFLGPYFPLRNEGDTYHYTWSNDTRHPEPIPETWQIMEQNWEGRSGYAISAYSEMTLSKLWFQDESSGVRLNGWSVWDRSEGNFPNYMVGVGTHLVMPSDVTKQPLTVGANWTGSGYQDAQATSTLLAADETVSVAAGTFTDALQIHTVITGTDDYMSGERDAWFAPGVGLIKLVYNHDDGSVTTAELVGGPYSHHIHLPLVTKDYEPLGPAFGDVIMTIPAPADGAQGLAWDGSSLWVVWGDIYKLDPTNGSVLAQIPGPSGDVQGLTWDGSTLWCVCFATDSIYQLDPSDGTVLNSFPSPGSRPIGIAWDGAYLWHSDENGTLYRLDPSDGSVVSSVSVPHLSARMLDWDGQYLWASADRLYQFDTSSWQTLKSVRSPATFLKGVAWDGENLWSGGWQHDTLYLLDGTPEGATIRGRVLKGGSPIAGKEMYIVKNTGTSDEMQVGWLTTDARGQYSFTVDPDVEYQTRGYGDTNNNEFHEWSEMTKPTASSPDILLADVDIWYDGLVGPADGAAFNRDQVSVSSPITFSWSTKAGASGYEIWLRQHNHWGYTLWKGSGTTSAAFDGTTTNGIHVPAMEYDWHVGMNLDSGWWVWSEHRSLHVTATPLTIAVDGNPGDWASAVPIATDAAGDNTGGPAGTDIGSLYSYVDDTDIYLLVEVHDPDIVYTSTIELNLDYKPGKHGTWQSTADLHTNIWNSGISAWTGDMEPYDITGAQVAFGEAMEIRIPRDQLEDTTYAIPTFVNIWVDGTGWDPSTIVP